MAQSIPMARDWAWRGRRGNARGWREPRSGMTGKAGECCPGRSTKSARSPRCGSVRHRLELQRAPRSALPRMIAGYVGLVTVGAARSGLFSDRVAGRGCRDHQTKSSSSHQAAVADVRKPAHLAIRPDELESVAMPVHYVVSGRDEIVPAEEHHTLRGTSSTSARSSSTTCTDHRTTSPDKAVDPRSLLRDARWTANFRSRPARRARSPHLVRRMS